MFRPIAIQSIIILFIVALLTGQGLLTLISALLLLSAGLAALWNRWALVRVSYEREISQVRAFPDDEIELRVRIANRKPLPLANLEVRDLLPGGLEFSGSGVALDRGGRRVLQRSASLRWYEALTWRYRVRCLARGAYRVGPAQITAGDPFGFYQSDQEIDASAQFIVYPRLLPLSDLNLPPNNPLGNLRSQQLLRDPIRTIGIRDYHPEDPLKDVHWGATARTGKLQTRIYEPTSALELAIFLDLDTFDHYWQGIDANQVERLISAAATLAQVGLKSGYAVGLYANGAPAQFEQLVRLPPGRSPAQLERILETLARMTAYSVTPMARVLRMHAGDLPWGATLLLVSAIAPEPTRAALARLRARGRHVSWLYLGNDTPPRLPGITVHHAPAHEQREAIYDL